MLNDQRGFLLLPLALVMLLMGFALVVPTLNYASTVSRTVANDHSSLKEQYAATAGVEHAIFRVLYDIGFKNSMNQIEDTASDSVQVNGQTVPITVTSKESGVGIPGIDYTVQAGHQVEFKVTIDIDADDDAWIVYDAVEYVSKVSLPSSSGTKTFYLHNNPTPPTGDTESQHPLPADQTAPTSTTLYNYDTDRNDFDGIQGGKSDQGAAETDLVKYQDWRTAPLASDYRILGSIRPTIFLAMKDFSQDKTGMVNVYVRDLDPNAPGCSGTIPPQSCYTEIAGSSTTIEPDQWGTGTYIIAGCAGYDVVAVLPGYSIFSRAIIGCAGTVDVLSWTAR